MPQAPALTSSFPATSTNDGKPDLITANNDADVSVLLSQGNGTFAPAINTPVNPAVLSIAVGDFNGDGKLDAVAASSAASNITLLLGKGLAFEPSPIYRREEIRR